MATKRYAEYRMIDDPELAGKYRKSFKVYSEELLLTSAFFYGMCATFLMGIFLVKYKIEFILLMPFVFLLFCYYVHIAHKQDSAAQKPEKLFKEKGLMLYIVFLILLFLVCLKVDIPAMAIFTQIELIQL